MPYNQSPSGGAYGDAFIVQTPQFDQARQQLLQEQMQRRMYQQKEATQIDGQLAKQLSRIRSVDTPEVFDAYNQYKNIKKQMLFDPKIKNNPQAYNEMQQKANEALATTFQKADDSARYSQMGRDLFTSYRGHPDRYADNFGEMIGNFNSTPMSKLADHETGDLSNPDTYMYKGSNTDFGAINKSAIGNPRDLPDMEEPVGTENLQTKITPFKGTNTPGEYYRSMVGALSKRGAGRDASAAWEHLVSTTPALVQQVNDAYNKITPDQWKRWTGSETPPNINPDPTNNADQFAAYQAKLYAVNNLPKAGTSRFVNNQQNTLVHKDKEREKLQQNVFKQQRDMEARRTNDHKGIIKFHVDLNRLYANMDADTQEKSIDQHFQDEFDKAKEQPPVSIPTDSGKPLVGFEFNPMSVYAKEFEAKDAKGVHKELPDKFILSPDGKTMTGVFLKPSADGKTAVVDDSRTKQKDVATEIRPVYKNFAVPKSKVPGTAPAAPPKPIVPVNGVFHEGMFNKVGKH